MDEDGERRVIKHRAQREGKGFITIEHPYALREVPDKIIKITGSDTPAGDKRIKATVLLECLANLVGNELYDNPLRPWSQDPLGADKATRLYIELLDKINLELSLRTGNPLFSPFC